MGDVERDPSSVAIWGQIIGKYHPTFLGDCQKAVDMSRKILGAWLTDNMLRDDPDATKKKENILSLLCDHNASAMHNRHFSHDQLEDIGLNIVLMENDDELRDKISDLAPFVLDHFPTASCGQSH